MHVPLFLMILVGARGFECARGAQASLETGLARQFVWRDLSAYSCGGIRRSFYYIQPFPAFAGFEKLLAYPCGCMIGKRFCVDYKKVSRLLGFLLTF